MRSIRIAHIPYLNSVPWYAGMADERLQMVNLHPRALGQAAAEGAVDAGLMSLADAFRSDGFEPLGDLGIALDGPAHSVLLFSRQHPAELDGATIGVTEETSTSYPLLRLLLDERFEASPAAFVRRSFESPSALPQGEEGGFRAAESPSDDGILLIGDAALRRAARSGLEPGSRDYSGGPFELVEADPFDEPYRWVTDLAAEWRDWQELPFVFARWMVRRRLSLNDRQRLAALLIDTLQGNLRRLDELAAEHAERAGISPPGAFAYLMGFTYRFGDAGERSIERFRRMLEATPWWEEAPPAVIERRGA